MKLDVEEAVVADVAMVVEVAAAMSVIQAILTHCPATMDFLDRREKQGNPLKGVDTVHPVVLSVGVVAVASAMENPEKENVHVGCLNAVVELGVG